MSAGWGFPSAWSPVGLQQARVCAGVCYEPVHNSALDAWLELSYPGLFSNLGYKAVCLRLSLCCLTAPSIALQPHCQQQGWAGSPTGFLLASPSL